MSHKKRKLQANITDERKHKNPQQVRGPLAARAAPRGGKRRTAPAESALSLWLPGRSLEGKRRAAQGRTRASLWLPGPLRPGKTHSQVQPNPRCCGEHENWNRTQRRARSI